MALKHVGRMAKNQSKIIVAYRTVPGDPKHAVVVNTQALSADEHDSLMTTVESEAGQSANEFAEMMARATLPDGRNMLAAFHQTGKMMKVATEEVEMQPDHMTTMILSDLNEEIAKQKGVTIDELAIAPDVPETKVAEEQPVAQMQTADIPAPQDNTVLSDEDLAAQYRSQADALYKEAKSLRAKAEELVPTIKKSKKATQSATG